MTTQTKHPETTNSEVHSTTQVVDPSPAAPIPEGRPRSIKPLDDPSRCQHRFPNGKRCRLPGRASQSGFCARHFNPGLPVLPAPSDSEDLSADLLPQLSEFDAALPINQFLTRLLILVTKGRVTPRRAAVLAYITNQLLYSQRAVQREQTLQLDDSDPQTDRQTGPVVIWDIPGADYEPQDSGNGAPK